MHDITISACTSPSKLHGSNQAKILKLLFAQRRQPAGVQVTGPGLPGGAGDTEVGAKVAELTVPDVPGRPAPSPWYRRSP
eukprot:2510902-Rhodomonas_salina.2